MLFLLALPGVLLGQCYNYTTNDDTITITGYTCSDSVVTIPSTINGLPVTRIGNYAFQYRASLRSVTIPNSVTNIGYSAFRSCVNLTNVAIGSGVASIGNYAFSPCPSLMEITVDPANPTYSTTEGVLYSKNQTALWQCPGGKTGNFTVTNSVTFVGNMAFSSCTNLTSVTIPNSVTNIGYEAFSGCVGLTNVSIGNSVANIPTGAFWYCLGLKTINVASDNPSLSSLDGVLFDKSQSTLWVCPGGKVGSYSVPTNVVTISYGAFYSCGSLTSVTIPDSVTSIQYYTFRFCTSLTNVTIGKSVSSIGSGAFDYCLRLIAITVDPANPNYSSADGVLFDKSQSTLWQYPGGKLGNYTAPHSVTTIWDSAFANCFNLTGITIDTNVTSIGNSAFDSCTNLSSITIPSGVTSISDFTFYNCTSLTNVSTPNTVTNIGIAAFAYCTSLVNFTIPNCVAGLGESAFVGCASLASVMIPFGVTSIGQFTFYACTGLTNVVIASGITNLDNYAFAYCENLVGIYFQGNAPSLGSNVFEGDDNTTVYYLPGTAGWGPTFAGRPTALWPPPLHYTYIASNGSITITGYSGPGGEVTIPDTIHGLPVTGLGESAFEACASLTSVFLPDSITNIGNGAFSDCTSMTNITIPNGITSIGAWVFFGCTSLTSIIIPDDVATIGYRAFAECTGLTNVTVGVSVIGIGNYAFAYCRSLKGVYFQGNAPSVELSAFAGDSQATIYYLPWTTGWGTTFGGRPTSPWSPPFPYTYTTNNGAITITGYTGPGGAVTIPSTINGLPVTSIGESVFENCTGLASLTIPDGVTNIGPSAFASCTNLLSVNLPNSVIRIGNGAFSDCTSLTNVAIPNDVTGIGAWVFYGCTSLTSVIIPDNVATIGYRAFSACASLTNITMGACVVSLGGYAFAYCEGLRGIYFQGNAPSVEESAFVGANQATVYYVAGTTDWGPTFGGRPTAPWGEPAQTYVLSDYYYQLYNGNEWVYDSHGGGNSTWTTIVQILQANGPVTFYSNCSPAVPYTRSLVSENHIQGDYGAGGAFNVDNAWTSYLEVGNSAWGWVGFDHDSGTQWRFAPGLTFTNEFAVGQTVAKTNVVYDHGVCAGQAVLSLQLVGFEDVQVPAGRFSNCMHLKLAYNILGEIRSGDEWWAKGVGPVKWTHIGGGDFETNELNRLSVGPGGTDAFPIATTVAIESGIEAAFDGSNYLVGVRGGPLAEGPITANLISQSGAQLVTTNLPGESGGMPDLAFDGTNYFMVWAGADPTLGFNGQFLSKAGDLIGPVLRISPSCSATPRAISLAFAAGKYLACWSDNDSVHGQLVNPNGQLEGSSYLISGTVQRARENAVGFDGTDFFVVFNGGGDLRQNIYGQFVRPIGGLSGGTRLIDENTDPSDNPLAVAFDGTNYLVAFNDQVGGESSETSHVYGRLVSTSGTVSTNRLVIAGKPGMQLFPFADFDGSSYLVSWSELINPTNLCLTLRFFDRTGQPLGPEFSPFLAQGTNSPVFGAPLFDGEKYLVTAVLANLTNGFNAASADVYGVFVPRLPRLDVLPPPGAGQFSLLLTGSSGFNYTIQMALNPIVPNWIGLATNSPTNGTFSFTDNNATNTSRFYRAVMPLGQ